MFHGARARCSIVRRIGTNFMPPADTAALICLSFTNAYVVSTIITFRCGRMSPPHSKSLGLKHVIVHFRGYYCWLRYEIDNNMGYCLDSLDWIVVYI